MSETKKLLDQILASVDSLSASVSELNENFLAFKAETLAAKAEQEEKVNLALEQNREFMAKQLEQNIQTQNTFRDICGTTAALISYFKEPNVGPASVDTIEAGGADIAAHKVGVDNQPPAAAKAEIKRTYFIRMWVENKEFRSRYEAALPDVIPKPKGAAAKKTLTDEDAEKARATACYANMTKDALHKALKAQFDKEHTDYKAGFTTA